MKRELTYEEVVNISRSFRHAANRYRDMWQESQKKFRGLEAELAATRELGPCKLHPKQFFESADPHDPGHCTLCDREKAAIGAALREAAKLPEKLYPHDSVFGLLKNNILALVPETGALERYTEAAIAAARLEEAKWWEHLVPNCSGNPDDCLYCQRLAELRSAITPDQSAARGGAPQGEGQV